MRPVLFELSLFGREVTVKSYTFFLVLAAVVVIGLGTLIARKRGLSASSSALCLSFGLISTAIGARMVHWLTDPSSFDNTAALFSLDRSNLSAFAGLLLGVPAAAITARAVRTNAWRLADASAPALGLGIAIARVGCLLNGCCFGLPTKMRCGIGVLTGGQAHLAQIASGRIDLFDAPLPVHPTQLYEAFAALLGCLLALWLLRRSRVDGQPFLVFTLWFTCFRWINSRFLYVPFSCSAPHWLYPLVYLIVIVAGATTLLTRAAKRRLPRL